MLIESLRDLQRERERLIEDSGYLIADLTAGNKNVYHEVGLLMGLNQARQKQHDNFLLLHNSSVGDVSKDFGFNISDFKQLRLCDTHSIGQEVKKQIAIYCISNCIGSALGAPFFS